MAKNLTERLADVPMARNARDSVRNSRIDSTMTYGVTGDPDNFGTNEADCIAEAERYDRGGYGMKGLNIGTGRSSKTKYTGGK